MKPPTAAPCYALMVPMLAEIAQAHGYALAVHGSLQRDLDLVAIPWTREAVSEQVLLDAFLARFKGTWIRPQDAVYASPELKPHGRRAWQIILIGGLYIDLSVMPRIPAPEGLLP